MQTRTRTVSPGVGPYGRLYVTMTYTVDEAKGRLSMVGVEGPYFNGNCSGSSGQCHDALDRLTDLDSGWTPEMVRRLKAEWERWHLNDLRAGCEHQRKAGWETRPIDPGKPLNAYGKHCHTPARATAQGLDPEGPATWNMLVWVTPKEHPDGLLGVRCAECGYRYGTEWRYEPVPEDVLKWLASLPGEVQLPGGWRV